MCYAFGHVLFALLKNEDSLEDQFDSLGRTLWTLGLSGSLLDGFADVMISLLDLRRYFEAWFFLLYVLLSAVTLMNILIGILREVVSAVANDEKEEAAVTLMRSTVLPMLKRLDENGNGEINMEELRMVLEDEDAMETLEILKVDVSHLLRMQEMLTVGDEKADIFGASHRASQFHSLGRWVSQEGMRIDKFMELVLSLRGDRAASVKDIIDGHAFVWWTLTNELGELETRLEQNMGDLI